MAFCGPYVPIVKGKPGEFAALAELAPAVSERLTPLLEVLPPGATASLGDQVARARREIGRCWGADRGLFVDYLTNPASACGSSTVAGELFGGLREDAISFIPVTRLDAPLVYQAEVKQNVGAMGLGVCVRLTLADADLRTLTGRFQDLVQFLGVDMREVDVVLDLGYVGRESIAALGLTVQSLLLVIPEIPLLRTVTLASAAFPQDLRACAPRAVSAVPRTDWLLWQHVAAQPGLPRIPAYGDYGIQHPLLPTEFDFRRMQMSASIRYTGDSTFVIAKGRSIKNNGWEQTTELATWVVAHADFRGGSFSAGDAYIARRSRGEVSPGSATTWRRVGTTHHFTMAVTQLASRGGL